MQGFCRGRIYPSRDYLACVKSRYLSRIDERTYLGADKSAPYNCKLSQVVDLKALKHGFYGFSRITRIG
ncbi:MAG: hypothetical protein FWG87_13025 [Defluviitaleaceae bacterium]|nr:hypothetical protein [Defluviitaleaceae bacterium]